MADRSAARGGVRCRVRVPLLAALVAGGRKGGGDRTGRRERNRQPATIHVTRIVPLTLLEGRASGEVEGSGRWCFAHDGRATSVRYEWRVRSTRRWMNVLAPFARPMFKWNHDQVMRQGAEGMARLLNAPLLSLAQSGE